jgi:hypothetical protein
MEETRRAFLKALSMIVNWKKKKMVEAPMAAVTMERKL